MSDSGLTHFDPLGRARMVDVTPKEVTHRRAIARGRVHMTPETASPIALWEKTGGRSGTYRRDPDASLGEEVLDGSFTGSTESGEISEV